QRRTAGMHLVQKPCAGGKPRDTVPRSLQMVLQQTGNIGVVFQNENDRAEWLGHSVSVSCQGLSRSMSYVRSTNPENYIFGDISGMVRHALQVAGHGQRVKRLHGAIRMLSHVTRKGGECLVIHAVDFVIGFKNMPGKLGVAFNEGPQ